MRDGSAIEVLFPPLCLVWSRCRRELCWSDTCLELSYSKFAVAELDRVVGVGVVVASPSPSSRRRRRRCHRCRVVSSTMVAAAAAALDMRCYFDEARQAEALIASKELERKFVSKGPSMRPCWSVSAGQLRPTPMSSAPCSTDRNMSTQKNSPAE